MYTEGFEGLEEAEKGSRRTYVSSVSQQDEDKLIRENERLKKSLEKEKFFNKLLDQEIQELKTNNHAVQPGYYSQYWSGNRGIPKGAFYTLLVIVLAMGAYIGYDIYRDKEINYLGVNKAAPAVIPARSQSSPSATAAKSTNDQEQTKKQGAVVSSPVSGQNISTTPPGNIKDSVPNIIGSKKQPPLQEKAAIVTQQAAENDEEQVATETGAGAPEESRPVIARYKVTSKANFYNAPDENTLRSTFIAQSPGKIVEALEEKNGFIYVVYTNDLGYTSKGWLSKKDLAKAE
jgi:hypothetical protein